jgi:hypothetical protein
MGETARTCDTCCVTGKSANLAPVTTREETLTLVDCFVANWCFIGGVTAGCLSDRDDTSGLCGMRLEFWGTSWSRNRPSMSTAHL